ncbi:hypothetical protein [Croceimicrobium sp.]|uniref:hypothetical protein n=1 Tax=Croceimicrobium sp. TaxID=2828340 RepID=UPI003BA98724
MSGFTKGDLKSAFAATGIAYDAPELPQVEQTLDPIQNNFIVDDTVDAYAASIDGEAVEILKRANEKAEQLETKQKNFSFTEGGNEAAGLQKIAQDAAGINSARKKEEEKKRTRRMEMMLALEASREALEKTLADLEEFGVKIDLKILSLEQEKAEKLAQIEEIDAIQDNIRLIKNGGEPELDEDGTLKDKALERVIQDHEKKTGKPVDRENPSLLLAIMEQSLPDYPDKTLLNDHVNEIDQNLQELHTMKGDNDALIDEGHALEDEGARLEENGTPEQIEDYQERSEDYQERADLTINDKDKRLDIIASRQAAREASLKDNTTPENTTSAQPVATMSFSMD